MEIDMRKHLKILIYPLFIFIAIAIIGLMFTFAALVVWHRRYDFFMLTERHSDILGPIGDFFGGILNPVFGLITILIVLWTARVQAKELKHSETVRDIALLESLLKRANDDLTNSLEASNLRDYAGNNFAAGTLLSTPLGSPPREDIATLFKAVWNYDGLPEDPREKRNHQVILKIFAFMDYVIKIHLELIKTEPVDLAKNYYGDKLHDFLTYMVNLQVLPQEGYENWAKQMFALLPNRHRLE